MIKHKSIFLRRIVAILLGLGVVVTLMGCSVFDNTDDPFVATPYDIFNPNTPIAGGGNNYPTATFPWNPPTATLVSTATPTPAFQLITTTATMVATATSTTIAQPLACIWKAAINVFVRTGPGASVYPEITAVETGTELPVIGQSEDGQFWAVELRLELIGYVSKSEKFGHVTGNCEKVPTLQDPATPIPTITPQCSDGIDNDRDGTIDMRDRGCTSPNDTSE